MQKRLQKERTFFDPAIEIVREWSPETPTVDRFLCWDLRVPYKEIHLLVRVTFPKQYPFVSPYLQVVDPVSILKGSRICHASDGTLSTTDILTGWSPAWTIERVVTQICTMLSNDDR